MLGPGSFQVRTFLEAFTTTAVSRECFSCLNQHSAWCTIRYDNFPSQVLTWEIVSLGHDEQHSLLWRFTARTLLTTVTSASRSYLLVLTFSLRPSALILPPRAA
jgi:hypothetical protein